ncbi:ribosome maturation factor RimP [Chlorobium sp. BLA1]|uniref:ribosome maturation factor RimP n=1 Tax=Candidatus Chlorobium masyuteum TaxID=2716876 RepID=UPI001420205D|nr:ribosome maturation factor RimP [Candidatus Chlorobium masyuteum]NHQ59902.1 ribosome maturation factor RimP [Candidatus Chlorobium masyuteum]NTU44750.1 ribosome maturation factor RimP [Chlorobiaceae bacterium]
MQERIRSSVLQIIDGSAGTRGEGAYLVDLKVKGPQRARKIEILVDDDSGVRIDQCAWLSRRLRELLEGDEELLALVGEDFEITVSSPGLGEPLMLHRQYVRHCGKIIEVTYTDEDAVQRELRGRLLRVSLSEESRPHIVIMPEKNRKKGSTPNREEVTLYLDQVNRAIPLAQL